AGWRVAVGRRRRARPHLHLLPPDPRPSGTGVADPAVGVRAGHRTDRGRVPGPGTDDGAAPGPGQAENPPGRHLLPRSAPSRPAGTPRGSTSRRLPRV